MKKTQQLQNMIQVLESRDSCSVRELCKILDVSTKTVHRYKKDLELLGYKIKSTRGEKAAYRLIKNTDDSIFEIEESNLVLNQAFQLAESCGNLKLASKINKIIKRNASDREDKNRSTSEDESNVFKDRYRAIETQFSLNLLDDVEYAIDRSRLLSIEYTSPYKNETTIREIEPYVVLNYSGIKYIIAFCRKAKAWRTFHILRVSEYAILSKTFTKREDYDIDSITTEFGLIREEEAFELIVHLYGYRAKIAKERILNDTQRITNIPNGIELSVNLKSRPETISWILSMGGLVKVISPESIIKEINNELTKTISYYKKNKNL